VSPTSDLPVLLTRRDIARLLDVELKKLTWWVWALSERRRYDTFDIAKRDGSARTISAPIPPIKDIQRKLAAHLVRWYSPPTHVHGYVRGRDPRTNAYPHRRQEWVLRIDLTEFFPTIHFGRVRGLFLAPPFDFGPEAATLLAQICCHEHKLPQGAPTSPVISNMICRAMDREISRLAVRERCYFTRYADDLTFSTDRTSFPTSLAYLEGTKAQAGTALEAMITQGGFAINEDKTRLVRRSQRQRVTGLVVNRQLNVPRDYIRELRTLFYIWDRYGINDAEASLLRVRQPNQPPGVPVSPFLQAIQGKVQYVGSVKGWHDPVYVSLADRLALLDAGFSTIRSNQQARSRELSGGGTARELLVCTEGETDVMHLKAAMAYFHAHGDYQDLKLLFDEQSAFNSDSALVAHLRALPRTRPRIATVCLFDRDAPSTLRDIKLTQDDYRDCGSGVACAALVAPPFRRDPFCVELLFSDDDLRTRDSEGRRVYTRMEFNRQTGQHVTEQCAARNIERGTLIREDVYEFGTGRSLALTKSDFAELVQARQAPFVFDFEGFRPTFEMLRTVALTIEGQVV
jgi:RNA-directed DNA polymerase